MAAIHGLHNLVDVFGVIEKLHVHRPVRNLLRETHFNLPAIGHPTRINACPPNIGTVLNAVKIVKEFLCALQDVAREENEFLSSFGGLNESRLAAIDKLTAI